MAVDKLVDSTQLDADLTSVANAIRAKSGGSSQLAFPAGFVSEIGNIPTGGQSNFTLIGTKVFSNRSEYTSTTAEELDTQIVISNTDYAFGYVVITCDTQPQSSTDWGMSVCLFGRSSVGGDASRKNVSAGTAFQQRGSSTLSRVALVANENNTSSYGVYLKHNVETIVIIRKAYTSTITKMPAGNYTVKVYGMTAL